MTSEELKAQKREYFRAYYLKNRERLLAAAKAAYQIDPESIKRRVKAWSEKNRDLVLANSRARYHATKDEKREEKAARSRANYRENRDRKLEESRRHHHANRELRLEQKRAWSAENRDKHAHYTAKRRAAIAMATPQWADESLIEQVYEIAAARTRATGIVWEVDHSVPLAGRSVCGLHVIENLRVVPRPANRSKSNKFNPDRPPSAACFFSA